MHTRKEMMDLAARAYTLGALRLYADPQEYDHFERTFQELALSCADGTLSDEEFLSKWEAFMSRATGTKPRSRTARQSLNRAVKSLPSADETLSDRAYLSSVEGTSAEGTNALDSRSHDCLKLMSTVMKANFPPQKHE